MKGIFSEIISLLWLCRCTKDMMITDIRIVHKKYLFREMPKEIIGALIAEILLFHELC